MSNPKVSLRSLVANQTEKNQTQSLSLRHKNFMSNLTSQIDKSIGEGIDENKSRFHELQNWEAFLTEYQNEQNLLSKKTIEDCQNRIFSRIYKSTRSQPEIGRH
eukprot:TRINITY_DN5448_c0_g1_i1.p1 TRINITY_DN5448_c0_g1~~TRINITY_DN5448_c0_g1_i1.p1  ORF type:complete len:114 (-),score=29.86 TRINITY_DN5448_c0_g1_i1:73-384(-)